MDQLASERMASIEDADVFCPYCGSECEAEWVDLGIDIVQAGPFCCPSCEASEIGGFAEDETYSEQELQTGWFEPAREKEVSLHMVRRHDEEVCDEIAPRAREKCRKSWLDMFRPQWLAEYISI
jgi:endogenous inhibitor of DNA gyrase (YacG/DUF329 family)